MSRVPLQVDLPFCSGIDSCCSTQAKSQQIQRMFTGTDFCDAEGEPSCGHFSGHRSNKSLKTCGNHWCHKCQGCLRHTQWSGVQTTPACNQALLTTSGQLLCSSHWHIGVLAEMSQSQGCLLKGIFQGFRFEWLCVGQVVVEGHCPRYYIFDYNLVEPAYLTTTDIRHDLFGFMLTYGDWGFLSRFYPISFMGFLAVQGSATNGYITKNYIFAAIGFSMYIFGMIMFRITNIEKHLFRDHMNNGGTVDKYRSPWSTRIIFGDKKVEFIKTKEGSMLLTSGYWGLARHFNYIGDLTMCIG